MPKYKTYCIAKCGNVKCEQHVKFRPQHSDTAQADFTDRCLEHVALKDDGQHKRSN